MAAALAGEVDLALELAGIGRIRLEDVKANRVEVRTEPGGVWLDVIARVGGLIVRERPQRSEG